MKNQIIIYPPIKVSPEEKKLIDSGAIELMSATVRDSKSKQIVRQLPVANKQYRTQNQNVGKLIGFGVVIGVAAFALTLALVNRYKKIKERKEIELVSLGNNATRSYITSIQSQKLPFSELKKYIEFIDALRKDSVADDVEIEFNEKELTALRSIILRYTKAFCEANGKPFKDTKATIKNIKEYDPQSYLDEIYECLLIQEKIYTGK